MGVLVTARRRPNAAQVQQQIASRGTQRPGFLKMLRSQGKIVAQFGQTRQILVRTEIVRGWSQCLKPSGDAFPQRPVDILERSRGGLAISRRLGFASQTQELAASLGSLL